jgi:hypothetical protein
MGVILLMVEILATRVAFHVAAALMACSFLRSSSWRSSCLASRLHWASVVVPLRNLNLFSMCWMFMRASRTLYSLQYSLVCLVKSSLGWVSMMTVVVALSGVLYMCLVLLHRGRPYCVP